MRTARVGKTLRWMAWWVVATAVFGLAALPGVVQAGSVKIFMVPKFTGAAYFVATEQGARQAVAELGRAGMPIDFFYTGTSVADTDGEIRIIDDLIAQRPDALIVSANDADALVPVLRKATQQGIRVVTYDADVSDPSARAYFVNQATFTGVGATLIDVVAEQAGPRARYAIISADPGAANQNAWIQAMRARVRQAYPQMQEVALRYGYDRPAESFAAAQDVLSAFRGRLDAIIAPTSVALPRAAEAVQAAGLAGRVVVTGLSTPNDMREFVKSGVVRTVVLWNPVDLGYLAVYVANALVRGLQTTGPSGQPGFEAGRLGFREAHARFEDIGPAGPVYLTNVIVLGPPYRFTAENIDQFNF